MSSNIIKFLESSSIENPCLVIDMEVVEKSFSRIQKAYLGSDIFYAVKANPAKEILESLNRMGSKFDVSSRKEIELCLSLGIEPSKLSYGNTLKKSDDIAWAYKNGVSLYVFDAVEELYKISDNAPGSRVFCRLQVPNQGAHWPLSNKFGCSKDMAKELLLLANTIGLMPVGISFHVGSQQTNIKKWEKALAMCKEVYLFLKKNKINIDFINIGGGIPISYLEDSYNFDIFSRELNRVLRNVFDNNIPNIMLEPGRFIVADAGIIESEVILVSKKQLNQKNRWVYLDIGRFGGLAETEGEAIRYKMKVKGNQGNKGPVIIAGPTCDGVDILYEKSSYQFPLRLKAGDKVRIYSTGAYTSVYGSNFNGMPKLKEYFINSK